MKKILLSFVMAIVSMGMWAQNPSVSFEGTTKATIEFTGDGYCTIFSDESTAKSHFGEEVWNQIKECTELVFVGKYNSLDQNNNNVFNAFNSGSSATTVDFTNAEFGTHTDSNVYGLNGVTATVTNMDFSPWKNTIEKAICSSKIADNTYITSNTFSGCSNLQEVVYNSGIVSRIANNASDMPNFKGITLNEGVKKIAPKAFSQFLMPRANVSNPMTTLVLPSTIEEVGDEAFFACEVLEVVKMKELTPAHDCTFGTRAFGSCFELKHVTLSEGVTEISEEMFDKCTSLEEVRIPTTVKDIRDKAFNLCASMHSIIIPDGVERIWSSVFTNSGLTDIYVMASTPARIPQIYSMGKTGDNQGATFLKAQGISNTHDPSKDGTHRTDITSASDDEIMTWYQDDLSDGRLGLGGGDCLVQLHYPDDPALRAFYDGAINPITKQTPEQWIEQVDPLQPDMVQAKKDAITSGGYISSGYAASSDKTGDYRVFGPSASDRYWPIRTDYAIRLLAGYNTETETVDHGNGWLETKEKMSSIGWRQLPIHTAAKPDDYIFSKNYDNTWYTMCFPWDLDDNSLFRAFNQDCEIAEFMGVEMVKDEEHSTTEKEIYNMIFHFDKVAATYYVTENYREDGKEYERIPEYIVDGKNTTRIDKVNINGEVEINRYTYRQKGGSEVIYWPFDLPQSSLNYTAAQREMVDKYNSIIHLIAKAGHPYMIHPSVGASPGTPTACVFAGVKKIIFENAAAANTFAESNAVTKVAGTGAVYNDGGVAEASAWTNPKTGAGGSYTFVGNITDVNQDMQLNDYYLGAGVDNGDASDVYPKFYRKVNSGKGKWSKYSAIIRPDANAMANIEAYRSDAASSNVVFGEWEVVDPTGIDEIIAEAEANNQEVKKVDLNVVFSVNGQVVRTNSTSVEGLPAGLYIVNGKKYMVK